MEDSNTIKPKVSQETQLHETPQFAETKQTEPTAGTPNPPPLPNLIQLERFLGMDNPTSKESDTLQKIYGYFENSGTQTMNELMIALNEVEMKIGTAPQGVNRLTHIYNYLKILTQMGEIERVKQSYERR